MKTTVHLQSKAGMEYSRFIEREHETAKATGTLDIFKDMCQNEASRLHKAIRYFLDDKEMNRKYKMDEADSAGWSIYNELTDKYGLLRFYMERG